MFQIVDARYENCYSRPDSNDFFGIAHLATGTVQNIIWMSKLNKDSTLALDQIVVFCKHFTIFWN